MDRYTIAKAKIPAAFAPAEGRDWCATCARRPCRRYAGAQRSGVHGVRVREQGGAG